MNIFFIIKKRCNVINLRNVRVSIFYLLICCAIVFRQNVPENPHECRVLIDFCMPNHKEVNVCVGGCLSVRFYRLSTSIIRTIHSTRITHQIKLAASCMRDLDCNASNVLLCWRFTWDTLMHKNVKTKSRYDRNTFEDLKEEINRTPHIACNALTYS